MVRNRGKVYYSQRQILWVIAIVALVTSTYAFSSGYSIESNSQLAVGNESDLQCMGGADAECQCNQGKKNGKCDPSVKGGGKIGCPCMDVTSGKETEGKCASVGKCKGEKTDGMMPMLPMLPMPMPKMPMMMPPPNCDTTKTAATTATSTASTTPSTPVATPDPACPPQQSLLGGISSYLLGGSEGTVTSGTQTKSVGSKISSLLSSLLGNPTDTSSTAVQASGTQGGSAAGGTGASTAGTQLNQGLSSTAQLSTGGSPQGGKNGTSQSGGTVPGNDGSTFVSSDLSGRVVASHTFGSESSSQETSTLSSTLSMLATALKGMLARLTNVF